MVINIYIIGGLFLVIIDAMLTYRLSLACCLMDNPGSLVELC